MLPQARNPTRAVGELFQEKRFPSLPRGALPTGLTLFSSSRRSSWPPPLGCLLPPHQFIFMELWHLRAIFLGRMG